MEPTNIPVPGVPDKDQVLDSTSDLLLGLPQEIWAVIAGLIFVVLLAQVYNRLPFKQITTILLVVVALMALGAGK